MSKGDLPGHASSSPNVVSHIVIGELSRFLLHDRVESNTLHYLGVGKAESAELLGLREVDGVRHDGADRGAEPVSDVDVSAVLEAEGLEGRAAGAF